MKIVDLQPPGCGAHKLFTGNLVFRPEALPVVFGEITEQRVSLGDGLKFCISGLDPCGQHSGLVGGWERPRRDYHRVSGLGPSYIIPPSYPMIFFGEGTAQLWLCARYVDKKTPRDFSCSLYTGIGLTPEFMRQDLVEGVFCGEVGATSLLELINSRARSGDLVY